MASDRATQAQARTATQAPSNAKPTASLKVPARLTNAAQVKGPGNPLALSKAGQKPGR